MVETGNFSETACSALLSDLQLWKTLREICSRTSCGPHMGQPVACTSPYTAEWIPYALVCSRTASACANVREIARDVAYSSGRISQSAEKKLVRAKQTGSRCQPPMSSNGFTHSLTQHEATTTCSSSSEVH